MSTTSAVETGRKYGCPSWCDKVHGEYDDDVISNHEHVMHDRTIAEGELWFVEISVLGDGPVMVAPDVSPGCDLSPEDARAFGNALIEAAREADRLNKGKP